MPELKFIADNSIEHSAKINKLLKEVLPEEEKEEERRRRVIRGERNIMTFQDILKIFEENDNFLILTHKSPDGDTLGSGFALCCFSERYGEKRLTL